MKPKYLDCLYHLEKEKRRNLLLKLIAQKCIIQSRKESRKFFFLTQRHDSHSLYFFIISSWLSRNTILACYVYVKFHNKKRAVETEARRIIIGHVGGSSAVTMFLPEVRFYFYLCRNITYFFSYMINHYMRRNNFLVDHREKKHSQHFFICHVEWNWVITRHSSHNQLKYFRCWHFRRKLITFKSVTVRIYWIICGGISKSIC